jgi:hypothetical protein
MINTYFLEIVSYVSDAGNVCEIGCLRSVDTILCNRQHIGWDQLSNMLPSSPVMTRGDLSVDISISEAHDFDPV